MSQRDAVSVFKVAAGDWRTACLDAEQDGGRFEGLFAAARDSDAVELRAVFRSPTTTRVIVCRPPARAVESIVDEIPAAAWDEREAADTHGLRFVGHEPLRPLVNHSAPLDAWTVPVAGHDTHQIAVGPIHAGVIESGHFRFHVVGERILHLDVQLFYKRRGLEAAATGRPLSDAIVYAQRACGACAVANTVAYAHACEAALGLQPDDQLRRSRTLLLELERVYNHLHDISAICAGVGFAPGTMAYATLKERAQRLNLRLTGHRFLFGTVSVGGSSLSLDRDEIDRARRELREIGSEHATIWRQLQFVSSLQNRLGEVGTLTLRDAERLGAVGPAARAAGLRDDVRTDSPRLSYGGFDPVVAQPATGDVGSRMAQRAAELEQSLGLLDESLTNPLDPGEASPATDEVATTIGIGRVESPRGRTVCLIERERQRLRAIHLRTGSYANWQVLAHAVAGNLLPEFPLINKSFELCYACVDR
ncbi:MAG: hydrogenase large subunit [Solirubrobacteraceae bacterium]